MGTACPGHPAAVLKRIVELQERYESGVTESLETLDDETRYSKRLNIAGVHAADRVAGKTQIVR